MSQLQGRCLCGAVQFSVPDDFQYAVYCHCSECRRFSGSLFSVQGGIDCHQLTIERGAERIGRYQKTGQSTMGFCEACGSSLFVEKPQWGKVHIRYGVLDPMPSLKPQAHLFVASKVPWYEIVDGLPQYQTAPER